MKSKLAAVIFLFLFALAGPALTQEEKLGKVNFPTPAMPRCRRSSSAAWRCCIRSGIAPPKRRSVRCWPRTLRAPSPPGALRRSLCPIPRWSRLFAQGAAQAQAAIEQGRKWRQDPTRARLFEAVASYYENWANRFEPDRQRSRAKAYEALAAVIRMTTRRRSSTRFISPAPSRKPIRPTQPISRQPRSWKSNSPNTPTIRAWPTT